jgi:FMN-dependent NADH-azoreductase
MKLLHVDSSILGPGSVSRTLSAEIVEAKRRQDPSLEVTYRDLASDSIGHLSEAHLAAAQGASPETEALAHDINAGAAALQEFLAADLIVIGAPMYNFGVPSQLKAWIDRLAIAGQTFRYTDTAPEGLCGGKSVIVASSRGNVYAAGSPNAAYDHQEAYLRSVFGFLGITDVAIVRAEGVAFGDDARAAAIAHAKQEVVALAA